MNDNEQQAAPETAGAPAGDDAREPRQAKRPTPSPWRSVWVWVAVVIIGAAAIVGVLSYQGSLSLGGLFSGGAASGAAVATVNGEEISEGMLDQRVTQQERALEAQGVTTTPEQITTLREQILEQLINERLIMQRAREENISAAQEDVTAQFDQIVAGFENRAAFEAELERNGLTETEVRNTVERQLISQEYLQGVIDVAAAEPTEAQVQELYDSVAADEASAPSFEQLQPQLVNQLQQQNLNQMVTAFLDELRADAEIVKNL